MERCRKTIPWGTIIVFGVGISLGNVLLKQAAAQWLSDQTFGLMGLQHMPLIATIALITLFNILIHLGFASATSLSSRSYRYLYHLQLHYI